MCRWVALVGVVMAFGCRSMLLPPEDLQGSADLFSPPRPDLASPVVIDLAAPDLAVPDLALPDLHAAPDETVIPCGIVIGWALCLTDEDCSPTNAQSDPCMPQHCTGAIGNCPGSCDYVRNIQNQFPIPAPDGTPCDDGVVTWLGGRRGACTCDASHLDVAGACVAVSCVGPNVAPGQTNCNDVCKAGVCSANAMSGCD